MGSKKWKVKSEKWKVSLCSLRLCEFRRNALAAGVLLFFYSLFITHYSLAFAQTFTAAFIPPDNTNATVGTPVVLNLEVNLPPNYRVIPPDLNPAWGRVEVLSVGDTQIFPNDFGQEITVLPITVTAWEPGTWQTGDLVLSIADPNGQLSSLPVAPTEIIIQSVLTEADTQLRDIRPQASLATPVNRLLLMALVFGGLMIVLGALGVFMILRRGRNYAPPETYTDKRPAYIIALDEIDAVVVQEFPVAGDMKSHYTGISDVLRRYIQRKYGVEADDETTTEIRRDLSEINGISDYTTREVVSILEESDLVKFAKVDPTLADADSFPTRARQWLELARTESPISKQPQVANLQSPPETTGQDRSTPWSPPTQLPVSSDKKKRYEKPTATFQDAILNREDDPDAG